VTLAELKGDVVVLACAVSAGVHGALVPAHLDEGTGAGTGFAAATVVLAGLVLWQTARPASRLGLAAAAAVFAGLLGSYALAVTSGVPVLHPEPEPVDGLALVTKAIEVVGLAAASSLLWRPVAALNPQPKGT
jgi:drug/metabolite transporter (DMT)-like permease